MSHATQDVVRSLSPDERLVLSGSLYFSEDDWLRLDSYNAAASVTLTVSGILINAAGAIVPFSFVQTPATDRTVTTTRFRLGEGFLIHVTVRATAGTVRRGQCFVSLLAQRWEGTGALVLGTLLSDYVSTAFFPSWPGCRRRESVEEPGIIRSITGTDQAANTNITETVPTGARWRLISMVASLVTDATVATRQAAVVLDDGTADLYAAYASVTQAASVTRFYDFNNVGIDLGAQQNRIPIMLPASVILNAGYRIRTATANLQVGDNWSGPQLLVEEWLNP